MQEASQKIAGKQFTDAEPLLDFIPRITPRWEAPHHLKSYTDILEKAPGGGLQVCVAAPPQHGKTEATIHALVVWLKRFPHLRFAYATYSQDRSDRVAKRARRIAQAAGLELAEGTTMRVWSTKEGGQLVWTSVDGSLTGDPVDGVLVIDDPIKGRKEAESPTVRENFKDWYNGTAEARLHPGASVICMMTRWHADDASGYLQREHGFDYVNLKAIADSDRPTNDNREPGEALWEDRRPLAMLKERQRKNPWNFASLYQGMPRPRGSAVFKDPARYRPEALPTYGYRIVYGVDLSYTEKTSADWSVCVELLVVPDGRAFVINVDRAQVEAPAFALTLKSKRRGKQWMYGTGPEKGSVQFMNRKGIPLTVMPTKNQDKFTRAIPTSEAWNAGLIQVPDTLDEEIMWLDANGRPRDMEWVEEFVDEVCAFTGVKDPTDDQVDALVSGYDARGRSDDGGAVGSGKSTRSRR